MWYLIRNLYFATLLQQVSVDKIAMKSIEEREEEINQTAEIADVYLRSGKDTLVVTSRQLVVGKSEPIPWMFIVIAFQF